MIVEIRTQRTEVSRRSGREIIGWVVRRGNKPGLGRYYDPNEPEGDRWRKRRYLFGPNRGKRNAMAHANTVARFEQNRLAARVVAVVRGKPVDERLAEYDKMLAAMGGGRSEFDEEEELF